LRQIGALTLIAMALIVVAILAREYKRGVNSSQLMYTRSVKKRDIVDAAGNALSALSAAELHEQNYVLTGETVYSEAYAQDIRTWRDEDATLELVAVMDPATPLVKEFGTSGGRTLTELALVMSLYEKGGRDAAMDRIRKSSGIVFLDQTRDVLARIREVDSSTSDGAAQAVVSLSRLAKAGGLLGFLTVISAILFISCSRST